MNRLPTVARWSAGTVAWATAGCWNRARRSRGPLLKLILALLTPAVATAFTLAAIPVLVGTGAATTTWRATRWALGTGPRRPAEPAERTRPRSRPTRRWPDTRPLAQAARRLLDSLAAATSRDLPAPVGVFAGRYQGAILWRPDVETFAAYLIKTTSDGEHREVWLGEHAAQYPTIESLAEALDAYDIGLDPASYDLARSYQRHVWDRIGSCHIVGTRRDDGTRHLTIHTPNGQTRQLAPATERDGRSAAFGPPTDLAWGASGPGALETARCLLDYTGSTTRNPQELFDDARSLVITNIRHWPPNLSIDVADLHQWAVTRNPLPHRAIDPAVHQAQAAARDQAGRPPRQRPLNDPEPASEPPPPQRTRRRPPPNQVVA